LDEKKQNRFSGLRSTYRRTCTQ